MFFQTVLVSLLLILLGLAMTLRWLPLLRDPAADLGVLRRLPVRRDDLHEHLWGGLSQNGAQLGGRPARRDLRRRARLSLLRRGGRAAGRLRRLPTGRRGS